MNLSELRSKFYQDIRENSSNSRFSNTEIDSWINEGYRKILHHFQMSDTERECLRTTVYTLCSDAGTSTGTTLYVDSVTGMTVGQRLYVWGSTTMERCYISAINASTLTITLASPGLTNSYTDGDYVASDQVWLPAELDNIVSVTFEELTTTDHSVANMVREIQPHLAARNEAIQQAYGVPTQYWIGEWEQTSETSLTTSGGTNTTTVVCPTLAGGVNDYYNDWMLINRTHTGYSRVSDYVASTHTISLATAITSQTTSDTFDVIRNLRPLNLVVCPDAIYNIWIRYNKKNSDLSNAWDIPIFDDIHHEILVKYAIYKAMMRSYNQQEAQIRLADYQECFQEMEKDIWYPTDGSLSFRTVYDIQKDKVRTMWGR